MYPGAIPNDIPSPENLSGLCSSGSQNPCFQCRLFPAAPGVHCLGEMQGGQVTLLIIGCVSHIIQF